MKQKKKRIRPGPVRIADDDRKDERMYSTLTRAEREEVETRAEYEGLSGMAFVRMALAKYMGWEK